MPHDPIERLPRSELPAALRSIAGAAEDDAHNLVRLYSHQGVRVLHAAADALERKPDPREVIDAAFDAGRRAAEHLPRLACEVPWTDVREAIVGASAPAAALYDRGWVVIDTAGMAPPTYEPEETAPQLRRFVVPWREFDGPPPTPGSFVHFRGAAYRVHSCDRLVLGGRLFVLEPVDAHDVPVLAGYRELPHPIADATDLPDDDAALVTVPGEAPSIALCDHVYGNPEDYVRCSRLFEHDGEHLGSEGEGEDRRERVWDTGHPQDDVDPGGAWIVARESEQGRASLEREGIPVPPPAA